MAWRGLELTATSRSYGEGGDGRREGGMGQMAGKEKEKERRERVAACF